MSPAKSKQDSRRDRAWHHGRVVLPQSDQVRLAGRRASTSIASKRKELAKAGVEIARATPQAAADRGPIVITSLPKPEALAATAKALAAAKLPSGKIICERSTFTIEDKEKAEKIAAQAGHALLDCPVSGTGAQAATGDLVIYASGDTKSVAKVKPLFAGFSRKLRRRRVRQWQPDEIRRQPAGRDQQRRVRRSHGAWHEGRSRSPSHLRDDLQSARAIRECSSCARR